jgi:RND family efflux transporter MFP subunit
MPDEARPVLMDGAATRAADQDVPRHPDHRRGGRSLGRRLLGLVVIVLAVAALALGVARHYAQHRAVTDANERHRAQIPTVRTDTVRASGKLMPVSLPATTLAFNTANIYARASGYIEKRYVDIGSRVRAGQPLADIVAPELDHQIAQAEASLAQADASLRQTEANRELARVTTARSAPMARAGWVTQQQADQDRLNYQAQQQATSASRATIAAQQAQLQVLRQQKAYQQVVAPFDGVVTQRNVDVGSLVQADTASGTAMFTMVHSDVIRVQVYVPQDAAFGLAPGVEATLRVPEMPDHDFRGTVTRIADALQPGTRTLLTEIDVPNPDGALTPGMYGTVTLQIPRRAPSFIVPGAAVIFNRQGLQVAVVENGTVHLRKITVIRDFGTEVEATDGVKNGDVVVLNPWVDLTDGSPVALRQDAASATP